MSLTDFPKGRGKPSGVAKEDPPPFNGRRVKQWNNTNRTRPDHERTTNLASDADSSINFFGDGSMKNPIEFREWFKILFRVWRPHLSPNEFLVAQFIFDRTAGWGKEWEVIRPDHFLSGVVGKDGKIYASGLVMTPPTLRKCLASLIDRGAIRMVQEKRKKTYALNYEWNPDEIENYATMPPPLPKRLKNLQELQTEDPAEKENHFPESEKKENHFPSKGKISFILNKKRKDKCFAKEETQPSASRNSPATQGEGLLAVAQLMDKVSRESANKRQSKINAWRFDSVLKAWHELCLSHHSEANHLSVTKTDCLILHKYGKRFVRESKARTSSEWLDYLSWVIERWHTIRESQFSWMKANSPSVPSIRFLVKFSDRFEQAWADKKSLERMAALSTRDREIEARIRKGVDRFAAEREVDERLGLLKAKQDAEAAVSKLKRQQASFEKSHRDHTAALERNAKWKTLRAKPQSTQTSDDGSFDKWE
jgi:hypothetical protein